MRKNLSSFNLMEKIISLNNISYTYPDTGKHFSENKFILKKISFDIFENEVIGITGFSGSGKSTLAKIILGILKPNDGVIERFIGSKKNRISPVQMLFQNSEELINPFRKIQNNLRDVEKSDDRIKQYLNKFQLTEGILDRKAMFLSGGERQRIALIKLLLADPKIIILDEPFSAQDPASNENISEIIKTIANEGKTVIIISHLIEELIELSKRILIMHQGKLAIDSSTELMNDLESNNIFKLLLKASKFSLTEKMPSDKL